MLQSGHMIDLIKNINEHPPWLFSRRFRLPVSACFLAMAAQAVPVDWVSWYDFALLAAAGALLYGAVFLLPHEKRRLKEIRKYLGRLELDKAKDLLSRPVFLPGVPFLIQRGFLQTMYYLHRKDLLGAYTAIVPTGKHYLLPKEAMEYSCLKGRIYWETGNIRDFIALFEDEKTISLNENFSTSYSVLKSHWYAAKRDLRNAKQVLESVIATDIDKVTKIHLYNELAVFEGRSGNKQEQISHLFNAAKLLKKTPLPVYFESVFHNLAINLLQEGRDTEARQVMNDYREHIDLKNVQQCLMFCRWEKG